MKILKVRYSNHLHLLKESWGPHLGSARVEANRKTLVKLTPVYDQLDFTVFHLNPIKSNYDCMCLVEQKIFRGIDSFANSK